WRAEKTHARHARGHPQPRQPARPATAGAQAPRRSGHGARRGSGRAAAGGATVEAPGAGGRAPPAAPGAPVRGLAADIVASLSETRTSQGVLAIARRPGFAEDALFGAPALVLVAV